MVLTFVATYMIQLSLANMPRLLEELALLSNIDIGVHRRHIPISPLRISNTLQYRNQSKI
jgi:hypothetical protein